MTFQRLLLAIAVTFSLLAVSSCESGPSGGAPPVGPCVGSACSHECKPTDYYCRSDAECCPGLSCDGATSSAPGVCRVPGRGCLGDGAACTFARECCSAFCEGGVCGASRCSAAGTDCAVSSWCCAGLGCEGFDFPNAGSCTAACGKDGAACQKDNDCCSGFECDDSAHVCRGTCGAMDASCGGAGDPTCCGATKCKNGKCSACLIGDCNTDDQCCDGFYCGPLNQTHICMCESEGDTCDAKRKCCKGFACNGGTCTCGHLGDECNTQPCCDGTVCFQGACRERTCLEPRQACSTDGECCSGECKAGTCCSASSESCASDAECCGQMVCRGGECTACTTLGASCDSTLPCCIGECLGGKCSFRLGEACAAGDPCYGVYGSATCGTNGQCCIPMNGSCSSAPGNCCPDLDCRGTCCKRARSSCSATTDCCSSQCRGGSCCEDLGDACGAGTDCCSGVCTAGTCACAALGASCTAEGDCCKPAPAVFPTCQGGTCCLPAGNPCANDGDCCAGTCRANGVCQ
jgi:hypothetical protein